MHVSSLSPGNFPSQYKATDLQHLTASNERGRNMDQAPLAQRLVEFADEASVDFTPHDVVVERAGSAIHEIE